MPRSGRIVVKNVPHHITQRGNNREDVFFGEEDRNLYFKLLKRNSEKYCLVIWGYCLMPNHVHLIATPLESYSLAKTIGVTHLEYTGYINKRYGRKGHLWQNRFYSCALDEEHFWKALRYAEANPVRANMVQYAWEYPWSSSVAHIGGVEIGRLIDVDAWKKIQNFKNWRNVLSEIQNTQEIDCIRHNTSTGRPLGDEQFVNDLELSLGKIVRELHKGRPRKT